MTITDTIDTANLGPLGHTEAMSLQAVELERTLDLLDQLSASDWEAPTECPGWDVRRMYLHVLGACEAGARMRENLHQLRAAKAHRREHGGPLEAALSAIQIRDREHLDAAELVSQLREVAPATIRGRRRVPAPLRRWARMSVDGPVHETWTLGYLIDTIYLRDLWMHRIDATRATGASMVLTADHDGRIVADVVAEWARRHGRPFRADLHGPAGGRFVQDPLDPSIEPIELDAVELCRTLAGRAPAQGLTATIVPF